MQLTDEQARQVQAATEFYEQAQRVQAEQMERICGCKRRAEETKQMNREEIEGEIRRHEGEIEKGKATLAGLETQSREFVAKVNEQATSLMRDVTRHEGAIAGLRDLLRLQAEREQANAAQ